MTLTLSIDLSNSSLYAVALDNYTTSYENAQLAADLNAIFGPPPLGTLAAYAYGLVFPVVAALGVVGNLTAAIFFWFVRRYRSHGSGSMASLLVGAHLVADTLFLICFVLSTTPVAVLLQQQNTAAVPVSNITASSNTSRAPANYRQNPGDNRRRADALHEII
jgi:hypothetical protein